MNMLITSNSFFVPPCKISFFPISFSLIYSVTISCLHFSRITYKWNHLLCTLFLSSFFSSSFFFEIQLLLHLSTIYSLFLIVLPTLSHSFILCMWPSNCFCPICWKDDSFHWIALVPSLKISWLCRWSKVLAKCFSSNYKISVVSLAPLFINRM